jgi:hypothetical protein
MTSHEIVSLIYQELIKVVGGATVVLAGLSIFLSKIWSERIARKEGEERDRRIAELKAKIDSQAAEMKAKLDVSVQRTVHVSKLQFEHEYTIYKSAWERLFSLRQATLSLRPTMDWDDPTETKAQRMQKRMKAFTEPYNSFLDVVEKNKPFYPPAIYDALSAVREKCHHELIDYEYVERPGSEYYKEARRNHEEIIELIENTCHAIRMRVTEVQTQ